MAKKKKPAKTRGRKGEAYTRHQQRMRERSRKLSADSRELGELPAVADPARKELCKSDLRLFLETYFPERFVLKWSADHLKVIDRLQTAVLRGGLFAMAMPRGSGKTSICEATVMWADLYGHHVFVVLIGASSDHAQAMLSSIKAELDANDLLLADFPEVCVPIRALEGNAQRARGQTHNGIRTQISWKSNYIVLPTIEGAASSGGIIRVQGITGAVRGFKFTRPDGQTVRPRLVIIDDPQTDESANSPNQCQQRLATITGAILGLAGPGQKISAVCPCTVIRPQDLADTLLDRDKCPQWQGERCKLIYQMPSPRAMRLWSDYAQIRAQDLRDGGDGSKGTEFYLANRHDMDEGALVAWPERFNSDEISALQYGMNLYFDDRAGFFSEYQNSPLDRTHGDDDLKPEVIVQRVNGRDRGVVPIWGQKLTAFVDVQASLLYWLVAAWGDGFTGSVVDYGTWPPQTDREYFALGDARFTLLDTFPGMTPEGRIFEGLKETTKDVLGRRWQREGGGEVRLDRVFIDAGYKQELVFEFCRTHLLGSILLKPSKGRYVGAKMVQWPNFPKREGEKLGHHWLEKQAEGHAIKMVQIDSNFWKSFVKARLQQAQGETGALTLFGREPTRHLLLADHLCAEYSVEVKANGQTVEEWSIRPERRDNHWFDGLVGCAAAASYEGIALVGQAPPKPKPTVKKFASFADYQRWKFGRTTVGG